MSKKTQEIGDEVFEALKNSLEQYIEEKHPTMPPVPIRLTMIQVMLALSAEYTLVCYMIEKGGFVTFSGLKEFHEFARNAGRRHIKELKDWLDTQEFGKGE